MRFRIHKINLMYVICDHLVGEDHSSLHRKIAGVVVMATGVIIAKSGHFIPFECGEYICDGVGYLVHGIGAVPFVESIVAFTTVAAVAPKENDHE